MPKQLSGEIDERKPTLLIVGTAKVDRHFRDNHLQRRPDPAPEKMASVRRPVCFSGNDVRVQARLAVLLHDVTRHKESTSTCSLMGIVL